MKMPFTGFVAAIALRDSFAPSASSLRKIIHPFLRRSGSVARIATSRALSSASGDFEYPLAGKTALVTGSSGGIGAAIAISLASSGADVIVHYNKRREGAASTCRRIDSSPGGRCLGMVRADFRDPCGVEEMFLAATRDARVDILVNNAGIVTKLAVEDDDDDLSVWHETMAVNLHAPVQLSRLAHKHMKANGGNGVIVNNSSIHGAVSVEYMTAYAASKAALDSVTRGLALEYAADRVRVNAVAPGVVPVERTEKILNRPESQSLWAPHLPVGRMGTTEEVAEVVLGMVCNEWVNGAVWTVDGGMLARSNMPIRPRPSIETSKKEQKIKRVKWEEMEILKE
uniref:Glucose 1-dehydrogenase n=1 Tax=Corethron hystrix TaxID=216773 RepID=A0A6U5E7P8_9STRA|mmetsp:Transcript_16071/g.36144  ORF Transcript_16071/g.36144 Transcript_16071/m.36144 type:complete len:342 (+) Transcript_16071:1-1026(+)